MDTQNAEEAFVFYRSFFEAMEGLADGDKLALFDAIARMGLYGEQIALPLEARRLFVLILPQLKANRKKREEGRKGGRYAKTTAGGGAQGRTLCENHWFPGKRNHWFPGETNHRFRNERT